MFANNPYVNLLRQAWHYAAGQRRTMVLCYALFLCANCAIIAQPWILGKTLNILQGGGADLFQRVLPWFIGYSGMMFIFWCFHGPSRVMERRLGFYIKQKFFAVHYAALVELPLAWHQDNHSGDTINRINKAGTGLYQFSQTQFFYTETMVRFVGAMTMMTLVAPWMALRVVVASAIILTLIRGFDKKLIRLIHDENKRDHFLAAGLFDYISNIGTIITLRLGPLTQHEIARRLLAIFVPLKEAITLNELKWFTFMMLVSSTEAFVMLSFIHQQVNLGNAIMVGTLVTVFQYFRQINEVFVRFAIYYQDLIRFNADLAAVAPIRNAADALHAHDGPLPPTDWQQIEIRNLNFAYHNDGRDWRLDNVNLQLPRGAKIALVGESGAGKSSVLAVLRGIFPAQADITVDGAPYDLHALNSIATLIPQDAEIFENSIGYNITLGVEGEETRMRHAASLANFASVAETLPANYNTDIREKGVNLSGGQKQRLALARGLFSAEDSSLLLLDEPTSSVDPATELAIFNQIFNTYPDKTIVASLHRLHLLSRFSWVYVMDQGRVVEEGTFFQLLQLDGGRLKAMWQKYIQDSDNSAFAA